MMTENFNLIILKIKQFIRKYYFFKFLRGAVISLSILLSIYLIIILLQYFFYFSVSLKTFIFYGFFITALLSFIDFMLLPLLKIFRITKTISYKQASLIIAQHFSEIKDKLLNVLELAEQFPDSQIALASIDQKINDIKIFDFNKAIEFNNLWRYTKYLLFPIAILLYLLFFNTKVIDEGTKRFLAYNVYIEPKPPFEFKILNNKLAVKKGGSFDLKVKINGDYIPNDVFINYAGNRFALVKDKHNKALFLYPFKNVNKSFEFYFDADGYKSKNFKLTVLPIPMIIDFSIEVIPPKYTGIDRKKVNNTSDLVVPYGSKIIWNFKTKDIEKLYFVLDSLKIDIQKTNKGFMAQTFAKKSVVYQVLATNKYFENQKLLRFNIMVIPDMPPDIKVFTLQDTTKLTNLFFKGIIGDDYGFTSLTFNYAIFDPNQKHIDYTKFKTIKLHFIPSLLKQEFYYSFDFQDFIKYKGKVVKYFFQVADNDLISGYKKTRTEIFEFKIFSQQQLDSILNSLDSNVEDNLAKAKQLAESIVNDIQQYQQKILDQNLSDWEKQDLLNQILEKQNQLQQLVNQVKKENNQKINQLETFSEEEKQAILQKQKQIQQLLDSLMTDDIRKLLEELQKLQQQFNSQKFDNLMKNMQNPYKELSENLDRNLELLKRTKIEQNVQNISEQMQQVAKNLDSLSREIKKQGITDQIKNTEQQLHEQFNKLQNAYQKSLKENKQLDKPLPLNDFQQQFQEIQQNFQQLNQNINSGRKNKTQKQMQKTSQSIQNLSMQMHQMMMQAMRKQNTEDLNMLKRLLESIIEFSFSQETLYNTASKTRLYTSAYKKIKVKQFKLKENFKVIKDSLNAIAKRNPVVSSVITKEVSNINRYLDLTINYLEGNNLSKVKYSQRQIIQSANILALFLEEAIKNINNQMQGSGSGSQQQPQQSMPQMSDLQQMQQSLKEQLEQMIQQMKQAQSKNQDPNLQRQLAEQIAKRELFNKMLQDMMNNSQLSPQQSKLLNEIKKANDQIKSDIINNRLTTQTLIRQQQIMVRLLEAEKAQMEQKFDDKRKAQQPDSIPYRNPQQIEQMFKKFRKSTDILDYNYIELNHFYKQYFDFYLNDLTTQKQ